MPITKENKFLIKSLFTSEGYNADLDIASQTSGVSRHGMTEKTHIKGRYVGNVFFIAQATVTGSVVSVQRCSALTADNIDLVNKLVLHKNG